jgi:hypothetical protein
VAREKVEIRRSGHVVGDLKAGAVAPWRQAPRSVRTSETRRSEGSGRAPTPHIMRRCRVILSREHCQAHGF